MPKASVDVDCGCSKDNKTSSFIFAALWLLGRLVYIRGVSDFNAKSGRKLVSKLAKMFKCTQANFICCCVCSLILLGLGAQGLIAPPRVCQPDDPCIQVSCDWWRAGYVTPVLTSDWSTQEYWEGNGSLPNYTGQFNWTSDPDKNWTNSTACTWTMGPCIMDIYDACKETYVRTGSDSRHFFAKISQCLEKAFSLLKTPTIDYSAFHPLVKLGIIWNGLFD